MNIQEFNLSVDVLRAVLWQYNDATNLISLLKKKQEWYDINHTQFWENWIRDVFDLRTANDFGCSVWAIILGVTFTVKLAPRTTGDIFGFGANRKNFNRGNFGIKNSTEIDLSLEQKRLVLQLRYFQLVSRGTVPETNQFLKFLFKDKGLVFVTDLYDMTFAVYNFTFYPDRDLLFILNNYDLLPRPAGVGVQINIIAREVFGFGANRINFNRSGFRGAT